MMYSIYKYRDRLLMRQLESTVVEPWAKITCEVGAAPHIAFITHRISE
jgi:hypothetical protein